MIRVACGPTCQCRSFFDRGAEQIHAGKSVPIVKGGEQTKMEVRVFVLAARTLKPHSLPGQPRVTLSLRKEHFKSSLRAMPGGKGGGT